ncbi:MAG TPA: immunity protein Tsi6 family protein [Candidatus Angelobacter sp.]|nr:immunity protein Tsi6 family protein [Candidatus Angelobacter sp.]
MNNEGINSMLNEALKVGTELAQRDPSDIALSDILKQLAYLIKTYEQSHSFQSIPKGKMTFGVIAAKEEYDVVYPEFARLLHSISGSIEER